MNSNKAKLCAILDMARAFADTHPELSQAEAAATVRKDSTNRNTLEEIIKLIEEDAR